MKYRIGILGGGNISDSHLRAAMKIEEIEISGICGSNREKVKKLADKAGVPGFIDEKLFFAECPMDLVAIGSPSGLHAAQGAAAASRGIHVLVEKPIDVTTQKADNLIEACERAGVKLGIFFQDRVSEGAQKLKALVDNNTLGKLSLATAHVKWYRGPEYYGDSKWRGTWKLDGGGAIMNQGIHTLDLLIWMLGNPRQVFGCARTMLHDIETEDTAVAVIEFESGVLATYEASTAAYPGQPRKIYLTGSQGTASLVHNALTDISLLGDEKKEQGGSNPENPENTSSPLVSDVSGHRRIMEDFIGAIREDRAPICDGKDARRSVQLVRAIYESSRTGRPVMIKGRTAN